MKGLHLNFLIKKAREMPNDAELGKWLRSFITPKKEVKKVN